MTTVVKMVGKSVLKEEIRAYIKARSKIGCSLKQIFAEISAVYGSTKVSYDTVRRWKRNLILGKSRSKMHPNQESQSLHVVSKCIKSNC